jgi:hypothetical protein
LSSINDATAAMGMMSHDVMRDPTTRDRRSSMRTPAASPTTPAHSKRELDRCLWARFRAIAGLARLVGAVALAGGSLCAQAETTDRSTASTADASIGDWRRIEYPGATRGTAAFAHVADVGRSDPRLAGLMLRCGSPVIEAVIVIVGAIPLDAQPRITLRANGEESYFVASVVKSGTGFVIPADRLTSVGGSWRDADELTVEVNGTETGFGGVIPLKGLRSVVTLLTGECARERE